MSVTRSRAERQGRRGETFAALYLMAKGWKVIARRVKTPRGEIDLVARRGRTVAFVEVKWRANAAARDQAIDQWRLRRVVAAAEAVFHRFAGPEDSARVDVILMAPWSWPRHLVNAPHG